MAADNDRFFPIPKKDESPNFEVEVSFYGDHTGDGSISLVSDGNGAFVEIKTDSVIRFDPDDLQYLADWARSACQKMDAYHGEEGTDS